MISRVAMICFFLLSGINIFVGIASANILIGVSALIAGIALAANK